MTKKQKKASAAVAAISLADINRRNKEVWRERSDQFNSLLEKAPVEAIDKLNHDVQQSLILQGQRDLHRREMRDLKPAAEFGKKFKDNADERKTRKASPIRQAIRKALKKQPDLKNPVLWEIIKNNPPKGWEVFENSLGKYIEGPTNDRHMIQRRFFTVCGEERKALKQ